MDEIQSLFSEPTEDEPIQLGPEPNDLQILAYETVFAAAGECETGDAVGTLWFEKIEPGVDDKIGLKAVFYLDGGTVSGNGGGKRLPDGKLKGKVPGSGTGKYKHWRGQIELDECNPKRWIFDPPLPGGES